MKTPCCEKEIKTDAIWNAIDDAGDDTGTTNKIFDCPECGQSCIAFLNIDSIQENDEEEMGDEP